MTAIQPDEVALKHLILETAKGVWSYKTMQVLRVTQAGQGWAYNSDVMYLLVKHKGPPPESTGYELIKRGATFQDDITALKSLRDIVQAELNDRLRPKGVTTMNNNPVNGIWIDKVAGS